MSKGSSNALGLRAGDLVEVRSEQEILTTLDSQGALDGMPFMPEMLAYCGMRFRVGKRADKTCNTITIMESRRLFDTVHLEDLRCNGSAHGGCQAECLLFWKESWLKRVKDEASNSGSSSPLVEPSGPTPVCSRERLRELTRQDGALSESEIAYRCQATDLLEASEPLPWWDLRQYVRDVWSGNVGLLDLCKAALFRIFEKSLRITAYRAQIRAYNCFQSWRGGTPYPYLWGTLDKTPQETIGIQPGELVRVKTYDEILKTLNKRNRNRGLFFGSEMVPYCGSVRRVRARVEHIIDERTGKLVKLPGECLILEGAVCGSRYSENRLFCPRAIFPYWREIWLTRVENPSSLQRPGASVAVAPRDKD